MRAQWHRCERIERARESGRKSGRILTSALPGRASLLGLATLLLLVAIQDQAALASPEAPAEIRGVGIWGLQIQNLDDSRQAVIVGDFYDQVGAAPVTVTRPNIGPSWAANVYLPAEARLGRGHYAAILGGDRPISAVVKSHWGDPRSAAAYNNALPGTRIVLPVFAGFSPEVSVDPTGRVTGRLSSIVNIQNTDTGQPVMATLVLRDRSGRSILERSLTIGPGTSITLDQTPDSPLAGLPFGQAGMLEVIAATPLAISSYVDVRPWAHAAMAFEALPVDRAARTLYAPLVASGDLTSWILVQNPGDRAASLSLTYRRNGDASGQACGAVPILHGGAEHILPARATLILSQSPGGGSGLPAGCLAAAEIRADQPLLAVVMVEDEAAGSAAAYTTFAAGDAGRRVALPTYQHANTRDRLTSSYQLMNPSAVPVSVTLHVVDSTGQEIPCSGCEATLAPGEARLWYPPMVEELRLRGDIFGAARVDADGPILAIIAESSEIDAWDMLIYAGLALCTSEGGPDVERCQPVAYLPHVAINAPGWTLLRALERIYLPLVKR